jgi:uncharacterized membrane protein YdbT with pleckstrin-like domain
MSENHDIVGKDEKVVEEVRRHWVSIVTMMFGLVVLGGLDFFGFYLLGKYGQDAERFGSPMLLLVGLLALLVFVLLLMYVTWWVYRQNRIVITDKNVYLISQTSLFSNSVDQFGLDRLQEVAAEQSGFFANVLNYGHVTAETAGEEKNLEFRHARQPHDAANRIMERHKQLMASHSDSQSSQSNQGI